MTFLATALQGKSTFEQDEPRAAQPPADVAFAPSIEPISAAQLEVAGNQLTIYFSEQGLAIENRDVARNEVVRRVAAALDATFASANGNAWLVDGPVMP